MCQIAKSYRAFGIFVLMILLSLVSGHSWKAELKEQALDSFLFLAPSGLIKNLGNTQSPYQNIYPQLSGRFREGFFDDPRLIVIYSLIFVFALLILKRWRQQA